MSYKCKLCKNFIVGTRKQIREHIRNDHRKKGGAEYSKKFEKKQRTIMADFYERDMNDK